MLYFTYAEQESGKQNRIKRGIIKNEKEPAILGKPDHDRRE